jgi:nucleotide-binding universal stress UspA family protein
VNDDDLKIKRILLALDASTHSLASLDTAAELARRLNAELRGLFVEDIDLLRMAELPFAAEIGGFSLTLRHIRLPDLEMQLRAQASHMRKMMAAVAAREGVPWEFRVVRGPVASEIILAAAECDLIIVGKRGWSMSKRLGSTVRMIITKGKGLTLVLQPGTRLTVPAIAVYDGTATSRKVLDAARALVKVKDGEMMILVLGETRQEALELAELAGRYMREYGLEGHVRTLIKPTMQRLGEAVRYLGPVVLSCHSDLYGDELCELVNNIDNPVLLVR